MRRLILTPAALLAEGLLLVGAAAPATAQVTFLSRSGESSYFEAGVHGYKPGLSPVRLTSADARRSLIRSGTVDLRPVWRETTREYFAPRLLRHGDHYDVVPGGYELRRSRSWSEW